MKNILTRYPILKETLESWAKILDDVVKSAILALPVALWFGNYTTGVRWLTTIGLILVIVNFSLIANFLRHYAQRKE